MVDKICILENFEVYEPLKYVFFSFVGHQLHMLKTTDLNGFVNNLKFSFLGVEGERDWNIGHRGE